MNLNFEFLDTFDLHQFDKLHYFYLDIFSHKSCTQDLVTKIWIDLVLIL